LQASELKQNELDEELSLLREAAAEAGSIALSFFGREPGVWMKTGDSPVSEADIAVDEFLRNTLLAARPDYGWLSEETVDPVERRVARRTFVVDPIDGTRGFIAGSSRWCVSVAIVENGRPVAGVLECPADKVRYSAIKSGGAWKDGTALRVMPPLKAARIGGPQALVDLLPARAEGIERVSHIPSLAYRLAMVAEGQMDATFVKPYSHDWDLAASDLILAEAGGGLRNRLGLAPDYAGSDPSHGTLVAGSGPLLDELSAAIAGLDH
jgi:myo-inositol-1(or 4)-monophosphatase